MSYRSCASTQQRLELWFFPKAGGAIATNKKRIIERPGPVDLNCMTVRPSLALDPWYLLYWFTSFDLTSIADGSVLPQISARRVADLSVPAPSLDRQRRIVEILEDHLPRLDGGASELARCRVRLDALWAAALSEARIGSEIALPEVADVQGGIQKQPRRAPKVNHYPFLRVANVTSSGLDLADVHRVELFGEELTRLRLEPGDLLVVEGNGSASQIGRAAMWDGSIEDCVHQNHLIRVRPKGAMLPGYLEAVWNSPEHRRRLMGVASSSSGLYTLSVSKLKRLTVPVPSLDAQKRAMNRIGDLRTSIRRLEETVSTASSRAESLRRAVLAAAFDGKLTGRHTDQEVIEELASV